MRCFFFLLFSLSCISSAFCKELNLSVRNDISTYITVLHNAKSKISENEYKSFYRGRSRSRNAFLSEDSLNVTFSQKRRLLFPGRSVNMNFSGDINEIIIYKGDIDSALSGGISSKVVCKLSDVTQNNLKIRIVKNNGNIVCNYNSGM